MIADTFMTSETNYYKWPENQHDADTRLAPKIESACQARWESGYGRHRSGEEAGWYRGG